MRGRPRQFNPRIPTHIEQIKLPANVYFDHRWGGGTWYQLALVDGRRRRKDLANAKATLADLHKRIEELRVGDSRGTIDWLCGLFAESDKYKALAQGTRDDYAYCREVLRKRKDKAGGPLSAWPVAAFTAPVIQRLVDGIAKTHPSKANHLLRYLRRLFRWGGNRGHCAKLNPADGIEAATERKQRQLPEPAVMASVIQYAAACGAITTRRPGSQPAYLWAVADIAYLCRLRGIEVVTLTDANATNEGVMTNRRKGSRDNVVTWTPRLRMAWDSLVERRDTIWRAKRAVIPLRAEDRPLVVAEDGAALRRGVLKTAWRRLMVAAVATGAITADQRFGMHAFKRRGITDTKGTKADKQQASGHKSAAMVDVYDFEVPVVKPAGE
ncbi:integrase [Dokdonella soli]|uniref:Tyrosine-type recombinase/integrase n=1 Tax=Dokdonella soli TaxID=529810 RepID=A0ABP3U3Z3_9GAMM